jgi:chromatin assembly factor 1 subunit A
MQQLNEAETNGDEKGTREIQALLCDRRRISAKLLQFHDNLRPPYYGAPQLAIHDFHPAEH